MFLSSITLLLWWMGRLGPVNLVNHTNWVAVVTPADRPKSVRNCCLIELFCGVVCVVTLPFWHFCLCRGFCHRTGSDLLLFVSKYVFAPTDKAANNVIIISKRYYVDVFKGDWILRVHMYLFGWQKTNISQYIQFLKKSTLCCFYCINFVYGPSICIKSLNEINLIEINLQTYCHNLEALLL